MAKFAIFQNFFVEKFPIWTVNVFTKEVKRVKFHFSLWNFEKRGIFWHDITIFVPHLYLTYFPGTKVQAGTKVQEQVQVYTW